MRAIQFLGNSFVFSGLAIAALLFSLKPLDSSAFGRKPPPRSELNLGLKEPTPNLIPSKITVITVATQCPLPTDCTESTIDTLIGQISPYKPDVVIGTEFFWKQGNYFRFADKLGLKYHARGPQGSSLSGTGGVVILSRYPFSEFSEDRFTSAVAPDNLTNKGTVYSRLRIGKGSLGDVEIQVVGNHFQAKSTFAFEDAQYQQVGQQAAFLRSKIKTHVPIIHGGDFNFAEIVPDWLCGSDSCRSKVQATWNRFYNEIAFPNGYQSTESEIKSSVLNLFYANGTSSTHQGAAIRLTSHQRISTISDHMTWIDTFAVIR